MVLVALSLLGAVLVSAADSTGPHADQPVPEPEEPNHDAAAEDEAARLFAKTHGIHYEKPLPSDTKQDPDHYLTATEQESPLPDPNFVDPHGGVDDDTEHEAKAEANRHSQRVPHPDDDKPELPEHAPKDQPNHDEDEEVDAARAFKLEHPDLIREGTANTPADTGDDDPEHEQKAKEMEHIAKEWEDAGKLPKEDFVDPHNGVDDDPEHESKAAEFAKQYGHSVTDELRRRLLSPEPSPGGGADAAAGGEHADDDPEHASKAEEFMTAYGTEREHDDGTDPHDGVDDDPEGEAKAKAFAERHAELR